MFYVALLVFAAVMVTLAITMIPRMNRYFMHTEPLPGMTVDETRQKVDRIAVRLVVGIILVVSAVWAVFAATR